MGSHHFCLTVLNEHDKFIVRHKRYDPMFCINNRGVFMFTFQNQPEEMKIEIFKHISVIERIKILPKVCKNWKSISKKMPISPEENLEISQKMHQNINNYYSMFWARRNIGAIYPKEHIKKTQDCLSEIKELINGGGDPNSTNECLEALHSNQKENKLSLLQGAVLFDSLSLVKFLISKGAKVNYQNATGHTALHYTAYNDNNHAKIAKYLCDHGADITLTNASGLTPPQLAFVCESDALSHAIITKDWDIVCPITDEEMSVSCFGQASNTAKLSFK